LRWEVGVVKYEFCEERKARDVVCDSGVECK